jgi:hypothetical protein
MVRRFIDHDRVAGIVRATFGPGRALTGLARLRGGSKKGVYRLTLDDGHTAILYAWDPAENYWPASLTQQADPFSDASGPDLFRAGHARLEALGVRTPQVFLSDGDIAIVEDVPGESLETLLDRDPAAAAPVLTRLGAALAAMHRHRAPAFGKLATVESGSVAEQRSCARVVLDRALRDLADAAARVPRIAAAHDRLARLAAGLAAAVPPRAEYGLIHGELGPDHVLVDGDGQPVLIDIEGLMFFDIEWEHAFLEFRFGEHYTCLRTTDLDEHRLRYYRLAQHLSLVAGPLRLLDGDFPEREPMLAIVEYNIDQVLTFLAS